MSENKLIHDEREYRCLYRKRKENQLAILINQMISVAANAIDARGEVDSLRLTCSEDALVHDLSRSLTDLYETARKTSEILYGIRDRLERATDDSPEPLLQPVVSILFGHQITNARKDMMD